MAYERIYLFGKKESKGSFDDIYDSKKYKSIQEAHDKNDYVKCDFVRDEKNTLYIECSHTSKPDVKKYHRLYYQRPFAGLDVSDDNEAVNLAASLL